MTRHTTWGWDSDIGEVYCTGDFVTNTLTGSFAALLILVALLHYCYWQLCCITITGSFAAILVCWLGRSILSPHGVLVVQSGVLAGLGWVALLHFHC